MRTSRPFMWMFAAVCIAADLDAAVTMPHIFGDNMVLQRGQPVPVWGNALPGERVTVRFAGQAVSAAAGADGRWRLRLAPLAADVCGAEFRVVGSNEVVFRNVVVGEVWFCSGQSNMEFTMCSRRRVKNWEAEVAAAKWPLIRHFRPPHKAVYEPQDDVEAEWVETSPETIPPQSAVAFFFGETVHKALGVPVGLINCSWGGSRIEPWIPAAHRDDLWLIQNVHNWDSAYNTPTTMWNGMVAGLVPYAIKGAIWYQGCANRHDGDAYIDKTVALVRGWRREWGQGDFPYYLVQLAPFKYGDARARELAVFQEAQSRIPERVANSGFAVINDVGDVNDIHPTDKRTVGMRLAHQVLDRVYGRFTRPWRTPTLRSCAVEGRFARVSLNDAAGLKTRDGQAPTEFELRDLGGTWVSATARIDGTDVVLSADGVTRPVGMRFAAHNGSTPNLVNGDGLPAGPFHCMFPVPMGAAESLAELKGMRCVQRYDIPQNADFSSRPPEVLASVEGVTRVAYLLELQKPDGECSFALAAMDAPRGKSDDLVLTAQPGARLLRERVSNLSVRSSEDGIGPVTGGEGLIEFYNCNYSPVRGDDSMGGSGDKYDYNDTPQPQATLGYGCLQVHNLASKRTVLAFNHFNNAAVPCDVGIGSASSGHPDWTFARNAAQYSARRMSVWVK